MWTNRITFSQYRVIVTQWLSTSSIKEAIAQCRVSHCDQCLPVQWCIYSQKDSGGWLVSSCFCGVPKDCKQEDIYSLPQHLHPMQVFTVTARRWCMVSRQEEDGSLCHYKWKELLFSKPSDHQSNGLSVPWYSPPGLIIKVKFHIHTAPFLLHCIFR